MKIAIINNLYPPFNRGGVETIVQQQIRDLAQQHDVFIITTKPLFKSTKVKINKNLNLKIYRFYPVNIFSFYYLNKFPLVLRSIWRLIDIFNLSTYFYIKKILQQERPDIIYTHNLTGLSYLIPRLIHNLNIKHIHIVHDVALIRPSGLLIINQEKESFFIKIYYKLIRYLFNSPNEVIFPSSWIKNYYNQHKFFTKSQQQVIKNFDIKIENLLVNKELKNKKQINFLYVGQLEKHKGILFLIQTLNKLNSKKYKLIIIGSGNQESKAKKLAYNNHSIFFNGWQTKKQINDIFKKTDYLIVPSLCYENSPTVIFEALKLNIPVIASNLGGISELIQHNANGYLFKANNESSLIKILKSVIIDI